MADAEGIWADKTDDELLEAAGELSEYTEEGERILVHPQDAARARTLLDGLDALPPEPVADPDDDA